MSDWQVGDLAASVANAEGCPGCSESVGTEYEVDWFDGVFEVACVSPPEFPGGTVGLSFASDPPDVIWCECGFRKIRPDEHESCEPEFVRLLKRSRKTVRA